MRTWFSFSSHSLLYSGTVITCWICNRFWFQMKIFGSFFILHSEFNPCFLRFLFLRNKILFQLNFFPWTESTIKIIWYEVLQNKLFFSKKDAFFCNKCLHLWQGYRLWIPSREIKNFFSVFPLARLTKSWSLLWQLLATAKYCSLLSFPFFPFQHGQVGGHVTHTTSLPASC